VSPFSPSFLVSFPFRSFLRLVFCMAQGTRRSQAANLTTESANEDHVPLQGTTNNDVTLQHAVDGQRANPRRPRTNTAPPAKRSRKNGESDITSTIDVVDIPFPSDATDLAAPATDSAPPAKKTRKGGEPHIAYPQ
jgi:hypothetical protein